MSHLGRSIDDRDKFLQVFSDKGIIEDPVLVFKTLEERVFTKRIFTRVELFVGSNNLFIECIDPRGQTTCEPK